MESSSGVATTTCVTFLLDSSGSMFGKEDNVLRAINNMFSDWKKKGTKEVEYNVYTFAENLYKMKESTRLSVCSELKPEDYRIGGMTSLYDAVVQVFQENKEPGGRTFVIITDGEDTSSSKYTKEEAKKVIDQAKLEQNASIVFIGEGERAFSESKHLNIPSSFCVPDGLTVGEFLMSNRQEVQGEIESSLFRSEEEEEEEKIPKFVGENKSVVI
jgi:uncharacterized protein YegL